MLNFRIEKKLLKNSSKIIIAMDEVGRGPIAGPVTVGAILINNNFHLKFSKKNPWWRKINDSKKLSSKSREKIFSSLKKKFVWSVGASSSKIIDKYGISKATEMAARKALKKICVKPDIILVDGNRKFLNLKNCPERAIVKGDGLIWSIACASIIAKVNRDNWMVKAHKKWPEYSFDKHKGYGTALHIKFLNHYGPCPLHRSSFAPVKNHEYRKSFDPLKRESENC